MGLVVVTDHVTMSNVEKRSVSRVLTIKQIVIATLRDIVHNGAATRHKGIKRTLAR
jgi:hypothetical protein